VITRFGIVITDFGMVITDFGIVITPRARATRPALDLGGGAGVRQSAVVLAASL
jgi:hypothetical protein